MELTEKQQAVLDFIESHIRTAGCPPTMRDMCAEFGWHSTNHAMGFVKALERKGHIIRVEGKARGIRLVKPTPCPPCGKSPADPVEVQS
jgi:repressor LexA